MIWRCLQDFTAYHKTAHLKFSSAKQTLSVQDETSSQASLVFAADTEVKYIFHIFFPQPGFYLV